MDAVTNDCRWKIYDDSARSLLGIGLFVSGTISLVLSGLMLLAFVKGSLLKERSNIMLLNLCLPFLARSLVTGFLFTGVSAISGRWVFDESSCKEFGFLYQFIAVYQIEAVTHMCIERYVLAKYVMKGWPMSGSRYVIFIGLCALFATLYSAAPLLGVGSYSWDFACTTCTFNMDLPPEAWKKWAVICIFLLQSLKPLVVIAAMIHWTNEIEKNVYNDKEHLESLLFTQGVIKVTALVLACWAPSFAATSWAVLGQLVALGPPPLPLAMLAALGSEVGTWSSWWLFAATSWAVLGQLVALGPPPLPLAMLAALGSEIAPAVAVAATYCTHAPVRRAMQTLFVETAHNKKS